MTINIILATAFVAAIVGLFVVAMRIQRRQQAADVQTVTPPDAVVLRAVAADLGERRAA